jgi:hypothetical protein
MILTGVIAWILTGVIAALIWGVHRRADPATPVNTQVRSDEERRTESWSEATTSAMSDTSLFFASLLAGLTMAACLPCGPGKYTNEDQSACTDCPADNYSDNAAGNSECQACPSGSTTVWTLGNSLSGCMCTTGGYGIDDSSGGPQCVSCGPGKVSWSEE